MRILNWQSYEKGSLQGFFTLEMDSGLRVHKMMLMQKNGARWVAFPGEKYTKTDGSTGYSKLIEFKDRSVADRFRDSVLRAIDEAGFP